MYLQFAYRHGFRSLKYVYFSYWDVIKANQTVHLSTGGLSSSCEMITLQNNIQGEIKSLYGNINDRSRD